MKNIRSGFVALCVVALAGCGFGRMLFSGGKVEGCMYWRGLAVHSSCIAKAGAKGAMPQKEFVDCIRSNTEQPVARTLEIATEGGPKIMDACTFSIGNDARLYYRYEPAQGLLFARRADCSAGCKFENRTYRVEFGDGDVRFEKLFESVY